MVTITKDDFVNDRQGRTFADVLENPDQPFDELLVFFSDENRQRRMEEAETHHDRPALAGVVRELESQPDLDGFLATAEPRYAKRFRQSVGVLVRMIMESRGWRKTGRKGSLGVRTKTDAQTKSVGTSHNTGGLAFWFLRAERYEPESGLPFMTVKQRCAAWDLDKQSTVTS
jgi:hypothetical protein